MQTVHIGVLNLFVVENSCNASQMNKINQNIHFVPKGLRHTLRNGKLHLFMFPQFTKKNTDNCNLRNQLNILQSK